MDAENWESDCEISDFLWTYSEKESHITMDDEVIRIKRTACCRLCLAPDNECVSIFKTCAADKEPLAQKIQSCDNIKVSSAAKNKPPIPPYSI